MERALYLHEVIDVTGHGAVPYMQHTVEFHAEEAAGRGLTLLGTWYVVGATGRWPQVVNLWEILDGWEGWRRLTDRTNLKRDENTALAEWWDEALQHRSGGFDRLCAAGPGCPSLQDLTADHVTGELFVHELSEVRPGAAADYLAAVDQLRRPVMEQHGHRLVGSYEVLMTDVEVVTVWATTLDAHIELMRNDDALSGWRGQARSWLTRWREELMTPHPGTPLAPLPG